MGAITRSGGIYSTIFGGASVNSFINLALKNGLATNDNPEGSTSQLLAGLSVAREISGDQSTTVSYDSRKMEVIDFTVQSLDAGPLTAKAVLGGKAIDETTVYDSGSSGYLSVVSRNGGKIEIQVKAETAPPNALFVVGATSNLPIQNCTIGVNGSNGLSAGGKAGLGIGIIAAIGLMGLGGFYAYQHFMTPKVPTGNHGVPEYHPDALDNTGAEKAPHVTSTPMDPSPPLNGGQPPVQGAQPPMQGAQPPPMHGGQPPPLHGGQPPGYAPPSHGGMPPPAGPPPGASPPPFNGASTLR